MTTAAPHLRHRRGGFQFSLGRVTAALLVVLACVALLTQQEAFRALEARVAGGWLSLFMSPVYVTGDQYIVPLEGTGLVSLRVTAECTSALLIAPVLAVIGFLMLHRRTSLLRATIAALVAAGGLFIVNQLRLGLIAWATGAWGMNPGYEVSHVLAGSVLSIVGFVAALLAALAIIGVRPRKR